MNQAYNMKDYKFPVIKPREWKKVNRKFIFKKNIILLNY